MEVEVSFWRFWGVRKKGKREYLIASVLLCSYADAVCMSVCWSG